MAKSPAVYDFAILTDATVDWTALGRDLDELRKDYGDAALTSLVLYGRPRSGEVVFLFRFAFASYSAALCRRMEKEAAKIKGRLVDLQLVASVERERFLDKRLPACELKVDATRDPKKALGSFRDQMGLARSGPARALRFSFESVDALLAAYARQVAEGAIFIPTKTPPAAGTVQQLQLAAPGQPPFDAEANVLEARPTTDPPGFLAELVPGEALRTLVASKAHERRAGRVLADDRDRRASPRYESWLEVRFSTAAGLLAEYATNISKGGLFIRSAAPPPLRSKVRLSVTLPDGEIVSCDAEVVHRVTPEQARERHTSPGVGVTFPAHDETFQGPIARLLEQFRARKARVLLVEGDPVYRGVLCEALSREQFEVDVASDAQEAMRKIIDRLFELDLLILDTGVPGLDGHSLLHRIRSFGNELDLQVVVLADGAPEDLAALIGPGAADDALARSTPLGEVVARIRAKVGH